MCMMCNGASLDEVRFHIHGLIERVGWAIVPVEGGRRSNSWTYTIGLTTQFDHPELIVAGLEPIAAGRWLNAVGERIREGTRCTSGQSIRMAGLQVELSGVDASHFTSDTFAMWVDYFGALGDPCPQPHALELVLPGRKPKFGRPKTRRARGS